MNVIFPPGGLTVAHVAGYAMLSFILTVIVTRYLIGWLKARQFGKVIRVDGPDHAAKAGTPTMGGMGMLAVIGGLGLVLAYQASQSEATAPASSAIVLILIAMFGYAVLGLWDDLAGLARKSGKSELGVGLTARRMIVLQVLLAAALAFPISRVAWSSLGSLATENMQITASTWNVLYSLIAILAIVGTVNGVNMSDGLDGLAAGLLAISFGWMGFWLLVPLLIWLALAAAIDFGPIEGFSMAINGYFVALALIALAACAGFLAFNRHPARVFMGNVTSMGMGALLAMWSLLALAPSMVFFLPMVGLVFLVEVLSDIIQIGYFRWTGGKRFFRMAPIHHHFEKGGMTETQVVHRFWLSGLLAGFIPGIAIWILNLLDG